MDEMSERKQRIIERLSVISPKWTLRIKENIVHPDLRDIHKCIVAEAWGFNDYYVFKCKKCKDFGNELYHAMVSSEPSPIFDVYELKCRYTDEFFEILDRFIRHYKRSHMI